MAITTVRQSVMDVFPISTHIARIKATDTIFTVSKNADNSVEFLNRDINGFNKATNKKEGKNIPVVAATAPGMPAICQPINVADEKTGPGVNWPTAMASTNS